MKTFNQFINEISNKMLWNYYNKADLQRIDRADKIRAARDDLYDNPNKQDQDIKKFNADLNDYNKLKKKRLAGMELARTKIKKNNDAEQHMLDKTDNDTDQINDYKKRLQQHDWHYMMSDDNSHYRRGFDNHQKLEQESRKSERHKQLLS